MKPTEAQRKWVWEQCKLHKSGYWWFDPSGRHLTSTVPPISLKNLFQYAVDWNEVETVQFSYGDDGHHCWLYMKKLIGKPFWGSGLTDEDALFWAIYKALGGE